MPVSLTGAKYQFISDYPGVEKDAFVVKKFKGREAMSEPYQFQISLATDQRFDPRNLLSHQARFIMKQADGFSTEYHGYLAELCITHEVNGIIFFEAILAPRIHLLSLIKRTRFFVDSALPDIIKTELADIGLMEKSDFEFRLQGDYPINEFISQYEESNFNFITRWMETEGIYFFFQAASERTQIIFTDTLVAHSNLSPQHEFEYHPVIGVGQRSAEECVQSLKCRFHSTPGEIYMKDYNYLRPDFKVEGRAKLDNPDRYLKQIFRNHFQTPEKGNSLAQIQAEAQKCKSHKYSGTGTVPFFRPGYKFLLKNHYRVESNQKYLLLAVHHSGHQNGYFNMRFNLDSEAKADDTDYRNEFLALEASVQYRMEHKTPKPSLAGVIHGTIAHKGDGEYAELDDLGRYKVCLPFEVDTKEGGPVPETARLRMQQPYGGLAEGMHFPLRKGAEVSLICTGGDPDRLEIAGAIPNPLTPSPVSDSNRTESVISTSRGNLLTMDDHKGSEGIIFHTPHHNTWMRLGSGKAGQHSFNKTSEAFKNKDKTQSSSQPAGDGFNMHTEGDYTLLVEGKEDTQVEGKWLEQVGSIQENDYDFSNEPMKYDRTKGVFISGNMHIVIRQNIIEHIGVPDPESGPSFDDTIKKITYVQGDGHIAAKDDCTISAQDGVMTLKMEKDKLTIDAGEGNDLNLFAKNQSNHWAHNLRSVVHGNSSSTTAGATESIVVGITKKSSYGAQEKLFASGSWDLILGPKMALSMAWALDANFNSKLACNLGFFKYALNPPINVSFSPLLDIKSMFIKNGKTEKEKKYSGLELTNGLLNLGLDIIDLFS